MVIERIYKESGTPYRHSFEWHGENIRRNTDVHAFHYERVYWYDGRKFYIGKDTEGELMMIEAETLVVASSKYRIKGKVTYPKLIESFKANLSASGKDIHHVVADYKKRIIDFDLWEINLLLF